MTRQPSKVHRLREELNRPRPTVMAITRGRNTGFGSAAFCSVLLVGLAQIEVRNNIPLQISVFSASFALPFWLLLGVFYEHYLSLGEQSYEHFRKPLAHNLRLAVGTVAGVGLVSATGGVIYF